MPLLEESGKSRRFRLSGWLPNSWTSAKSLGTVRSMIVRHPFPSEPPAGLVDGSGWLLLPHDPVMAVAVLPFALRILESLQGRAELACVPSVAPWIPKIAGRSPIQLPSSEMDDQGWCHGTADRRRSWAWSLDHNPDSSILAGLLWLGGLRRISPALPAYTRVANILLSLPTPGTSSLEDTRSGLCARLGFPLAVPRPVKRLAGKSIILALPPLANLKQGGSWIRLAAALAEKHSLIVVHFHDLSPDLSEALRGMGNRLSALRISRPEDVQRIAGEVKAWVGPMNPAAVLASQQNCPVVSIGSAQAGLELGPDALPDWPFVRFLSHGKPSAPEVLQAVLDLSSLGM